MTPTQDMVIGAYYLTSLMDGEKGEGDVFGDIDTLQRAYESGAVALHAKIKYRAGRNDDGKAKWITTTPGRIFFNEVIPSDFGFLDDMNDVVDKRVLGRIVDKLAAEYSKADVAEALDGIKDLCFSSPQVGPDDLDRRRQDARRASATSSTATKPRPRRSRPSSAGASSPMVSAGRRKSRSGPTPPRRSAPRWRSASRPSASTPST